MLPPIQCTPQHCTALMCLLLNLKSPNIGLHSCYPVQLNRQKIAAVNCNSLAKGDALGNNAIRCNEGALCPAEGVSAAWLLGAPPLLLVHLDPTNSDDEIIHQ